MPNVFLKPPSGQGFYVSRSAVLRCIHLEQLLIKTEAAADSPTSKHAPVVELEVPNLPRSAFSKIMEHCERPPDTAADSALVDALEVEVLLQLVGAAHRLGAMPLLSVGATRVAKLMAEASGSTGERAGMPMDIYLRRDPLDALDEDVGGSYAAEDEFIFSLPTAADAPPPPAAESAAPPSEPGQRSLMDGSLMQPKTTYGRYGGASALPSSVPFNAHMVPSTATATCAAAATSAAGAQGVAGTGEAGAERKLGVEAGADRLVQLLGGEAPLLACLVKLDARSLRSLKPLGKRWRYRARTALCSGAWAEGARAMEVLDLGRTRHWQRDERTAAAKFLSNGGCAFLSTLMADGYEASLQPLLQLERFSAADLIGAITQSPGREPGGGAGDEPSGAVGGGFASFEPDALCAQSEFCSLLALWTMGSSHKLREAECTALTYAGMLPLADALGPAVELGSRRCLEKVFLSKNPLPVRDLVGLPPPPPPVGAPLGSVPSRDRIAATSVDLRWRGLGALDAQLIGCLLRANRVITHLDLSWNSSLKAAGSYGAQQLCDAIAASRTLANVDLSETSIGEECAPALRRAVRESSSLSMLVLRTCALGADARAALVEAAAGRARTGLPELELLQ